MHQKTFAVTLRMLHCVWRSVMWLVVSGWADRDRRALATDHRSDLWLARSPDRPQQTHRGLKYYLFTIMFLPNILIDPFGRLKLNVLVLTHVLATLIGAKNFISCTKLTNCTGFTRIVTTKKRIRTQV
jgi:hypothetical protein